MPRSATRQPPTSAAPAPAPESLHEPDPPEPEAAARDGREANGRFAKGNHGGPGNPFARQTAAFRRQLLEAVTPQDMEAICATLILRARAGSVPHVKLLFSYVIGKPTDAVNPDTLDLQEMQQYRQELGMEELTGKVGRAMTPEVACTIVQTCRPILMDRIRETIADQFLEGVPPEHLQPDGESGTVPRDDPAPSANGAIGAADGEDEPVPEGETRDEAPLTNGANGGERPRPSGAAAPDGNGPKRPTATGRVNPAGPASRPAPAWPSGRPEAPTPETGGPDSRTAPRERGPVHPGAPAPPPAP